MTDPAVLRRRLGATIKDARTTLGYTQDEIATELGWGVSKIIRIETGRVGISRTDLLALLGGVGITDPAQVDDLKRTAEQGRRQLWNEYIDVLDPTTVNYYGAEASASVIREAAPLVLPGLLQTEAYARAIMADTRPHRTDRLIAAQHARQALLQRPELPELRMILDESVIRRQVGGPDTMRHQLAHLAELDELPHVEIRVVPLSLGAQVHMLGPFAICEFPHAADSDLLYWPTGPRGAMVASYKRMFDDLHAAADPLKAFG